MSTSRNESERDTVSLLDIVAVLVKRRWIIIGITGIAAVFTLAFLVYTTKAPPNAWNPMPNIYKPTVKMLINSQGQSSTMSSLMSQSSLSQFSALLGIGGGSSGGSASALAKSLLLKGNMIADQIANEFGFAAKYKITNNTRTAVREKIRSSIEFQFDDTSGILAIGYRDTDPAFATVVVNRIVELLDQQFKQLTMEQVDKKMEYLQQSIKDLEAQSNSLISQLVEFQKKYGIIDSSSGATTPVTESGNQITLLKTQLSQKQVDLSLSQKYLPDSDSRIVKLKTDIAQLEQMVKDLEAGTSELSASGLTSSALPDVTVRYITLKRDSSIAQAVLSTLKQQYEASRLQAADNSSTLQILEKAEVPETRDGPSRSRTAVIAVIVAFFISLFAAFFMEYFSRAKKDEGEGAKLAAIKGMLSFRKKAAEK